MQDLVPPPGIEPRTPALRVWHPTHWTTREVPVLFFFLDSITVILFYFIWPHFMACGMWYLSSLTRDRTRAPCRERGFLPTEPPGKAWDTVLFVHVSDERKEWNWYLLSTYCVLDIILGSWRNRGMSETESQRWVWRGEAWTTSKVWATWGHRVRQKKEMVALNV